MRLRLIRRRRSPTFWALQRREFLTGWAHVESYASFDLAMQGARAMLRGEHPDDIIEIVSVRGDA